MRRIDHIVVHCADTPAGAWFDVEDIRAWHKARGFKDVGYHYVILLDGTVQMGRSLEQVGAHVRGFNLHSIGICYIGGKGGDTRTEEQKASMEALLYSLKSAFPEAAILGHRDFPKVTKQCPNFDVRKEYGNIK